MDSMTGLLGMFENALKDKVVLVTGASQGIGAACARAYGAAGASVILCSRSEDKLQQVADAITAKNANAEVMVAAADLSDAKAFTEVLARVLERFGRIDVLLNNATPGGGNMSRIEAYDPAVVEHQMAVNYYAALQAMQAVFPAMKAQAFGRIITMCSLNGINAHRYSLGYNSAKEALRALCRTAAVEWARYGITSNIICPSAATEPWDGFKAFDPEGAAALVKQVPMQRMGDSDRDVAPLAVFLATDAAGYLTGNTIHADGGGHINGVPWSFELPEST